DVGPQLLEPGGGAAIIVADSGIGGVSCDPVAGVDAHPVGPDHGVGLAVVCDGGDPGRVAAGVPGGVECGHHDVAEPHGVAVAQHAIDLCRRPAHRLPVPAVVKIAPAAVLDRGDVAVHDRELRPGQLLEVGDGAGMVG